MATLLDYLASLEQPQAQPENLPFHLMAGALQERPDIRQARPAPLPGLDLPVTAPAPQATEAGVYGSGAGGFLRRAIEALGQSGIAYRSPGFSMRKAPSGEAPAIDRENEALRTGASMMAKRRWEKARKSIEEARGKRKAYERGRPKAAPEGEEREKLDPWIMEALGSEAPTGGVIDRRDYGRYASRARALQAQNRPKTPRAPGVVRENPVLRGILAGLERDANRALEMGLDPENPEAVTQAAADLIRDMIQQANTARDLSIIEAKIRQYPEVVPLVESEFDEKEALIGAAR